MIGRFFDDLPGGPTLIPKTDGTATIRSTAEQFFEAFRARVAAGLLTGRPHPRSNYVVTDASTAHLELCAAGWWTAINVGLNRLTLRLLRPGLIRYDVQDRRWARYVLGLCSVPGLVGLALLLSIDVRGYIARHPSSMIPGTSIEQNLSVAWLLFRPGASSGLAGHLAAQAFAAQVDRAPTQRSMPASPQRRGASS